MPLDFIKASPAMVISMMAMVRAREVSFTSVMISLDIGGTMRFTICSRVILKKICLRVRPSTSPASRCPAGISHPMVGVLARRLTGKYIAPKAEHLEQRVEDIHHGAFDELIEQIMQKPITEMQELYNNREIEK